MRGRFDPRHTRDRMKNNDDSPAVEKLFSRQTRTVTIIGGHDLARYKRAYVDNSIAITPRRRGKYDFIPKTKK